MPETVKKQQSGSSFKKKLATMPLLPSMGVALVVHLILALAIGGYVVFEGVVPTGIFQSDFIDTTGPLSPMEEAPMLIEEEPVPQLQSAEVHVPQMGGGSDAPDMSDLITVSSVSNTPTFSMPTTSGNPALLGSLTKKITTGRRPRSTPVSFLFRWSVPTRLPSPSRPRRKSDLSIGWLIIRAKSWHHFPEKCVLRVRGTMSSSCGLMIKSYSMPPWEIRCRP